MAGLPDPTDKLTGADREIFDHMASARAHADGRAQLGDVYVRMFNNPGVAAKVGALGEYLRFNGTLPDEVRELVILRFASREKYAYEWSHHQRPAKLAGIDQSIIDAVTAGDLPDGLTEAQKAALRVVDAVAAKQAIPDHVQRQIVAAFGTAGVVEIVVLCGLYAIMGDMCIAFDIEIEDGFPYPPF